MIHVRHALLFPSVVVVAGCFDDAKLRPYDAGNDLVLSEIPAPPPDGGPWDASPPDSPKDSADLDAVTDTPVDLSPDTDDGGEDAPPSDVPAGTCTLDRVLVGTSDLAMHGGYALGRFLPTPTLAARMENAPDFDHIVVQSGCIVYDLLRGDDELAVLDRAALPNVARRIPLRPAMGSTERYQAKPQGVLTLSPTIAYVVLYNAPRVAVADPTQSGAKAVRRTIDLSPLRAPMDRDGSGAMEAAAIVRAGRYVFVALQNLHMGVPVSQGTLAVLDPASDTLVDTDTATPGVDPVRLTGRNPVTLRVTPGGRLVVAEAGVLGAGMLDGGIEVIDPVTLSAQGLRVTEAQLGGDVGDFVMFDDARGWVIVRQTPTSSRVVEFDLDAGEGMRAGRTIVTASDLVAIARDPTGNVWVLDRSSGSAGVRVFNTMGTELTTMSLGVGAHPPSSIAFVP